MHGPDAHSTGMGSKGLLELRPHRHGCIRRRLERVGGLHVEILVRSAGTRRGNQFLSAGVASHRAAGGQPAPKHAARKKSLSEDAAQGILHSKCCPRDPIKKMLWLYTKCCKMKTPDIKRCTEDNVHRVLYRKCRTRNPVQKMFYKQLFKENVSQIML